MTETGSCKPFAGIFLPCYNTAETIRRADSEKGRQVQAAERKDHIRTSRRKRGWLCLLILVMAVLLGGCQVKEKALALIEEAVVLFGGEPQEVRTLRKQSVPEEDGIHQEYYFSGLSQEEKRVYRELLEGIRTFEEEIYVTTGEDQVLEQAYGALLRDHGELFWIHGRGTVYKTLFSTYGIFRPYYGFSKEEAAAVTADIESRVAEILAGIDSGASAYEKARYVYGYVIQHTVYEESIQDQNVAGVLQEGRAVCAGYARTVQYLLEQMGVPCIYVSGEMKGSVQGHAWNLVELDGAYYYLDATNGDQQDFLPQLEGEAQQVLYDYLCPFPAEYEAICQPDPAFAVPVCTETGYNAYVQRANCFEYYDTEAIRSYLMGELEAGQRTLSVKYTDARAFAAAKEDWITKEEIQSVAMYYMELTGISHVQYSYGILEDLYTLYFMF